MPSSFPPGDPAPPDGSLPASALQGMPQRPFSVYLHVPFCRVRCGYCDFNTYTLPELDDDGAPQGYLASAHAEIELAARVLRPADPPPVSTVFVGGGTPTLLPATDLGSLVAAVRERWGLAPDAEVTTEANPDTITPAVAEQLAGAGFTRVSVGMQSSVPHVLRTLDRTHDPAGVAGAVQALRDAGLQVSLDLIYGTPGESLADWRASLDAAVALGPDHVSAYALVVEPGTRLHGQVRRGEVPAPEDDDEADKYELAEEVLGDAGYRWYEISNWARSPEHRCRHNLAYWQGADWWGVGPGAHSHVGGVRWWNVKHPRAYADRLGQGLSPAHAREVLGPEERHDERVLLGVRLGDGLPVEDLRPDGRRAVAGLVADGLLEGRAAVRAHAVLTLRGRLLADTVVHRLLV
ncbi:radical SAM family heme chaperone HemW [uncultured Serinicoccus sp.]|uniref:radical SAM family heme chaperone HemW n=1 Tax=uncultured Serinicoccus sp. TaxID=735514 RepID=UPI002609BCDE|nr:radical SAM family heme chaperone HemW [uncultured Serinicoccus sp.]